MTSSAQHSPGSRPSPTGQQSRYNVHQLPNNNNHPAAAAHRLNHSLHQQVQHRPIHQYHYQHRHAAVAPPLPRPNHLIHYSPRPRSTTPLSSPGSPSYPSLVAAADVPPVSGAGDGFRQVAESLSRLASETLASKSPLQSNLQVSVRPIDSSAAFYIHFTDYTCFSARIATLYSVGFCLLFLLRCFVLTLTLLGCVICFNCSVHPGN